MILANEVITLYNNNNIIIIIIIVISLLIQFWAYFSL